MKKLIAFAVPILPGKTNNWKTFANELKTTWAKDFTESRKKLNLHERTFLQTTPTGDFVIVTLEGTDPETSLKTFATSTEPFSKWFVNQVKEIHGMDLTNMNTVPTLVLDTDNLKVPAAYSAL